MTPRVQVSGAELVKLLERHGFTQVSQRGSHVKLKNSHNRTVIVPLHRTLAPGTLNSILAQAGVEFEQLKQWMQCQWRQPRLSVAPPPQFQ